MALAKRQQNKQSDLDFEISFFEGLLKRQPGFIQAILALAEAYTKKGDYQKGLALDKRLSRLRQTDPVVYYNLSCSYSLLGLIEEALTAIEKAILLGYDDFEYMLSDPDLKNLRNDERFGALWVRLAK